MANDAVTSLKIKNGEVKTEDLASGAVTLKAHRVTGSDLEVAPGHSEISSARCPSGKILLGGGYLSFGGDMVATNSSPDPASNEPEEWQVIVQNLSPTDSGTFGVLARCAELSP